MLLQLFTEQKPRTQEAYFCEHVPAAPRDRSFPICRLGMMVPAGQLCRCVRRLR